MTRVNKRAFNAHTNDWKGLTFNVPEEEIELLSRSYVGLTSQMEDTINMHKF